jgi:hypothetical protein
MMYNVNQIWVFLPFDLYNNRHLVVCRFLKIKYFYWSAHVVYCTILYRTVPCCTVPYHTVLYCTCLWIDSNVRPKLVMICSSYFGGLCLIPGQAMWDLWWTMWHLHKFFWMYLFSPFTAISPMLHINFFNSLSPTPYNLSSGWYCYITQ